MSDDLATRSLGVSRLTLGERRQQYEAWLASGRRIPKPESMIKPADRVRIDDLEPKKEHKPAPATLNELPLGAIVRTDDEPDDQKEISDDLRLNFAKALLPKVEGSDPAIAERLVNAATAMLSPMVRADQEVKGAPITGNSTEQPLPPSKPGSSPLNRRSDEGGEEKPRKAQDDNEEEDKKGPTLAEVMAALDGLNKRLDNIEAKGGGEEEEDDLGSEDNPDRGAPRGPGEGTPKELAADDAEYRSDALRRRTRIERMDKEIHSWKNQDRFAEFQRRADQVSQLFGKSSAPPMAGETLGAYKRRTVREWQKFSPAFKNSDLRVLQVADGVAFNVAIEDIMARADKEGRNPSQIPAGYLAERSEVKGGHTFTRFYGRPSTWMNQFAPHGKRVRRIIERGDSGISRTLYERA